MTYIQYAAVKGTTLELPWLRTWVLLSPWFLNWVWVTGAIFMVAKANENEHLPLYRKLVNHAIAMLTLLFVYVVAANTMRGLLVARPWDEYWSAIVRTLTGSVHLDVFIYLGVLALAVGMRFYHQSLHARVELRKLQVALIEEQLKTLRTQLNPHFLFNALNTIASLVRLKRESEAVKALSSLSMMLRTILDNKNQADVKIKDEISFIKSYLTIQKMRFDDKLDTQLEVDSDCFDLEIPNMLLHPLVENAIQHGSQSEAKKNPLQLHVKKQQNMLHIRLINAVATNDSHHGYGIGISNTRERLARLYENFHFDLRQRDDGMFETRLAIPLGDTDA